MFWVSVTKAQQKLLPSLGGLVICSALYLSVPKFTQSSWDNNITQSVYLQGDNYGLVCSWSCPQDANVGYLFALGCCDVPPEISLWTKTSLGVQFHYLQGQGCSRTEPARENLRVGVRGMEIRSWQCVSCRSPQCLQISSLCWFVCFFTFSVVRHGWTERRIKGDT